MLVTHEKKLLNNHYSTIPSFHPSNKLSVTMQSGKKIIDAEVGEQNSSKSYDG